MYNLKGVYILYTTGFYTLMHNSAVSISVEVPDCGIVKVFCFTYINHSRPWCSLTLGSVFSSVMVPVECSVLTLSLCSIFNTRPNGRCEAVRKSHKLLSCVPIKLALANICCLCCFQMVVPAHLVT